MSLKCLFQQIGRTLLACAVVGCVATPAIAATRMPEIRFGVVSHPFEASADNDEKTVFLPNPGGRHYAFTVVNGIKNAKEPCSDEVYLERRNLLNASHKPLVVSLAASDWTGCRRTNGRTAALERLNRLRELFFEEDAPLGPPSLKLSKQSAIAKFRSFDENVRWNVGPVLFATVNLPSNNNNYRADAGRNSEFDDRLIADRNWLRHVFSLARQRHMHALVLFCDADPMRAAAPGTRRDGFAEIRKEIRSLAGRFDGEVLLVHGHGATRDDGAAPAIAWEGNLGRLGAGAQMLEVRIRPDRARKFSAEAMRNAP